MVNCYNPQFSDKVQNKSTTLQYYDENVKEFVDTTRMVDFSEVQNLFLSYLESGAVILDFGCGSGRDTKYFLNRGYQVEAIDGSAELCKAASEYTGILVRNILFQQLNEAEAYDGIWACASILHLPKKELHDVLQKMSDALKKSGIIYSSFKYGEFEGVRNGRYFTDLNETSFVELIYPIQSLQIEKIWITGDVRAGRGNERWLNVIMRKK